LFNALLYLVMIVCFVLYWIYRESNVSFLFAFVALICLILTYKTGKKKKN